MANSSELCLNCHQSFYQKALHSLKLEDFSFAGRQVPSLACFVESNQTSKCPKVCSTCLALINNSHITSKRGVLEEESPILPAYVCATCGQLSRANNLMSMRLTVLRVDDRQVNLEECAKACMKRTIRSDVNLMICLTCLSVIAEEYQRRDEKDEDLNLLEAKSEPVVELSDDDGHQDAGMEEAQENDNDDDSSMSSHRLSPVFEEKPAVKKLNKSINRKPKFFCAHCPSSFRFKYALIYHMKTHFPEYEINRFQCFHCPKLTSTKRYLHRHLEAQHFRKSGGVRKRPDHQKCVVCLVNFYNRQEFNQHMKIHKESDKLQCDVCKKTFAHYASFGRHKREMFETFQCTKCDVAYHTAASLHRHMETQHDMVYTCEICNSTLFSRKTYEIHQLAQHGIKKDPRRIPCKNCGEKFKNKRQMLEHTEKVHETKVVATLKELICDQCGQVFEQERHLKTHQVMIHAKREKHVCHICKKRKFRQLDALERHIQTVHVKGRHRRLISMKYACEICPLRYGMRQHLEGHMLCHNTENRPFFQCGQCGVAYTRRQKLQIHMTKCPMSK